MSADHPMRVLQVHNGYGQRGGEDTIVETEANLLQAAGHVVERLRVTNPTTGAPAVVALARAPRNIRSGQTVYRCARATSPDVAHVHNTWFSLSPEVFHRLRDAGVPIVMTLQNYRLLCSNAQLFRSGAVCTDCVGRSPWRGVVHRCYRGSAVASAVASTTIAVGRQRHSFQLVDRFLAPSRFVKSVFVQSGFPSDRIVVRPNVVDDPGPRSGPPSSSRTLLYAGRLSKEKGLVTLLDGWRRSGLAGQGFVLRLIGDGPLRSRLEQDVPTGVELAGWMPEERLHAAMGESRALLFPSEWYENFGRVIIEAMASGLPVLASNIATPAEIVGPIGPGWLVPPADGAAWGRALASLADDVLVDSGGAAARALYENHYTTANGLHSLLAVYRDAISGSRS
jgi:glycosyltransferase involved in cell wall biosynthesis